MASLRELIIKISANSQSFQSEISRASRMGTEYYKTMQNGGRQAAATARESQRALSELNSQFATVKSTAAGMAGAFAGAFATGHLISLADEWNSVNARLKQATQSNDDFQNSQRSLMDISQRTGTAFSDNAGLFARSAASMREFGYSSNDVLKITEAVSTGLKLSGANTQEASSVITQFSQALAQGVLRGEEFNSVNENGDRVIRALAAGMGVARKDLKAMADDGKLTIDKVVPALISQLGVLRGEFESMPQTVSGSVTKVENAFMAWVGGANDATGATKTLTTTLNTIAGNIDNVAAAAGALVAIGVAKYFGGIVSGAASATAGIISATRSEIALAEAQVRGTQVAVAHSRAAVYRAQQAVLAAQSIETQIAAEKRLAAAQSVLTKNIAARSGAQTALNGVTSTGSRLLSGALGLVGGIPGLVMLGAGAWYTMYQNQEQARQSAQDYARTIDEVRQKSGTMSLTDAADNQEKARQSLTEQNRLVAEQQEKVRKLKIEIEGYQRMLANPGLTVGGYMVNHLMSIDDATKGLGDSTSALAVEQQRLSQMQDQSQNIQSVLERLEYRRVDLIRQQAGEQNSAYRSLLMMNGQHSEFNRLLSLGNNLLSARSGMVSAPLRIPSAALTDKQSDLLLQSSQNEELSRLKGSEKARRQAEFNADRYGLTNTPEHVEARNRYINSEVNRYNNDEANKPKKKGPKTEEEKAEDSYKRVNKQYQEQIALSGQSTELAKVKYQVTQGELSTLDDLQKTELLRNASALDHLKTQEKFKELQEELLTPEEALLAKTRERIALLKEAAPATEQYRDAMERISKASVTEAPKFGGIDASVGGASGELFKVADAEKELKKWHKQQLEMQKKLLDEKVINEQVYADRVAEINQTNNSRLQDIQAGYTSASLSMFSDLASQSASLLAGMGKEGSAAYKALFIASKAAAIAQAIINTELAATKAMAEGGMIFGIPAATAIRAVGYASVGLIAAQTIAGMAHDGIDRVPETGTWLLQKGERVVTAQTSAKLDSTLERVQQQKQEERGALTTGFNYSPTIQVNGNPDDVTLQLIQAAVKRGGNEVYDRITNNLASGQGRVSKAVSGGWTTGRRKR